MTDLNAAVRSALPKIRRLTGATILPVLALHPRRVDVRLPAAKLRRLILDLADVAANDMPGGGGLTIRTKPGALSIEVTGEGSLLRGLARLFTVESAGHPLAALFADLRRAGVRIEFRDGLRVAFP